MRADLEAHPSPGWHTGSSLDRPVRKNLVRNLSVNFTGLKPEGYPCCFCGEEVEQQDVEPILATVVLENDGEQNLYCHAACLPKVIHPSVPLAV